jgi:iron complex outermembrane receptor protein
MKIGNVARGLLLTVGASLAVPVGAQGLEEIVVTARKREESLQGIPMTISVFNEEALDRYHITDLKSVAKYTPGLTFDEGFVQQDTRPQIRGLPATRGRPPVGILLDGIDISSESMVTAGGGMLANLALVDAERIEVVKGPQSALYGRVAFGGAVNYVTKKPGDSFEADVTVDVGDNGQLELKAGLGGPVSETFGVRFNVAHASHDGFYQDTTSGTDVGTSESTGFSLAGQFTPNDRFDVSSRIMFSESEWSPRPQYALLTATNSSVPLAMPTDLVGVVIGGTPLPASVLVPRLGDIKALDQVQLSLDPRTGQAHKGATLDSFIWHTVVNYQVTDTVTLTSWTGYTDADSTQDQDTDFFGLPFAPVSLPLPGGMNEPLNVFNQSDQLTETRQISQEFRLSDLESDGLRWAVGYQYWREDVAQQNRNIISVLFGIPGFAASAGLNLSLAPQVPYQQEFRDTEHQSVYGLLEYDFTDRLTGVIEARYSDEDFDQAWLVGGISAFGFIAPFAPAPAPLGIGIIDSATTSDDFFTPRATLEFQYDDDTLYYGTISKGAKPGGVSSIFGTNSQTGRFFPETLWNYELGVKTGLADGQVILNAAVFYMDYTDRQINTLEPSALAPGGFALFTRNQGAAKVLGLEMDATWLVTENWTLTGAYAYLDTEVTDGRSNTTGALSIATAGNCTVVTNPGGNTSCTIDTTGQSLERIPENELIVSSIFRRPINSNMDLGFDVTVRYQDDRSMSGADLHIFPSFTMVDARVGIETARWDAYLYADNLFDDDTIKSGQTYGDLQALGNLALTAFAPDQRQIGIRANYHFGD